MFLRRTFGSGRSIAVDWTAGLPHQILRMAFNYVLTDCANAFETHSFIESLSSPIEGRNAQEHVRMFAKNSLFDMFDEQRSNAAVAPFRHDAEQMNIAAKWSANVQQHKASDLLAMGRDMSFTRRIHQWFDTVLVSAAKGDPGLGSFEGARADFGFGFAAHATDEDGGCFWHVGAARQGHRGYL